MESVGFPVVFYDGETETSIGNINVYPSVTNFKSLQSTLSRKIGISPHQFTVYLAFLDHKKPKTRPKFCRRVPVTAKTDFSAVSREGDSFFLVVLKRRRRHHNANANIPSINIDYSNLMTRSHKSPPTTPPPPPRRPPANVMLLRRESDLIGTNLVNMGLNGPKMGQDLGFRKELVCEECLRAREMGRHDVDEFHWCVHDAVTFGFRSPAGPISRPAKRSD